MRLREPFSGYKLTAGHYLYHIAFLISSYLPMDYEANKELQDTENAREVLGKLRLAHCLVPVCYLMSKISK